MSSAVVIALIAGLAAGLAIAVVWWLAGRRAAEAQFARTLQAAEERLKAAFGEQSRELSSYSTTEFLKLAHASFSAEREAGARDLESKKGLIDQHLGRMSAELDKVSGLVQTLEKDREQKFGELTGHLKTAGEQTAALMQTTGALREALASSRSRGQWGERMAEDVLRLAGFCENVNYQKQKAMEGSGARPDFTFLLPRGLKLNMDVKFPLDNYVKFVQATAEADRANSRRDFLRDVRIRMKEVTTREYISPENNTVDCVLLFIPNEHIYSFIHEEDSAILDEGLKSKVVFCSPVTLFAVLAVVRQAVDSFSLEQTSNEILGLLGGFKRQWADFVKKMDVLGKRIEDAQKEYQALAGTRRRALERPLEKLDSLRMQRGLAESEVADALPPGPDDEGREE